MAREVDAPLGGGLPSERRFERMGEGGREGVRGPRGGLTSPLRAAMMRTSSAIGSRAGRLVAGVVLLLLTPVVAALFSGGCGGEDRSPDLDRTSWTLVRWSEEGQDPAGFRVTAAFADGQVSGKSAVNSYGGPYTTGSQGEFATGDVASTMMAGPQPAMRAERAYFELLTAAASYQEVGDTLTLYDEFGDEALVFTTAKE